MALSVHVEVRALPLVDAHGVYARLSTSSLVSYTCRQHSKNPAWPTSLIVHQNTTGNVILTIHAMRGRLEDRLLGLIALHSDTLRKSAPLLHQSQLKNGATVLIRVENIRAPTVNIPFAIAASSSRLRRRARVVDRRIPLVLVIFRAAENSTQWVPVFRGAGCAQGDAVFFDDAKLDLVSACLGDLARPIRIALYRISPEKRFKIVAFFETSVIALQALSTTCRTKQNTNADVVTQPLQGRFYDDAPGNVTVVRVPSDDDTLRIAVRFDVFNSQHFISSFSRPATRRNGDKLSQVFDEKNSARSKRMDSTFSASSAASRVELSTAYDEPPPSYKFSVVKPVTPLRSLLMRI